MNCLLANRNASPTEIAEREQHVIFSPTSRKNVQVIKKQRHKSGSRSFLLKKETVEALSGNGEQISSEEQASTTYEETDWIEISFDSTDLSDEFLQISPESHDNPLLEVTVENELPQIHSADVLEGVSADVIHGVSGKLMEDEMETSDSSRGGFVCDSYNHIELTDHPMYDGLKVFPCEESKSLLKPSSSHHAGYSECNGDLSQETFDSQMQHNMFSCNPHNCKPVFGGYSKLGQRSSQVQFVHKKKSSTHVPEGTHIPNTICGNMNFVAQFGYHADGAQLYDRHDSGLGDSFVVNAVSCQGDRVMTLNSDHRVSDKVMPPNVCIDKEGLVHKYSESSVSLGITHSDRRPLSSVSASSELMETAGVDRGQSPTAERPSNMVLITPTLEVECPHSQKGSFYTDEPSVVIHHKLMIENNEISELSIANINLPISLCENLPESTAKASVESTKKASVVSTEKVSIESTEKASVVSAEKASVESTEKASVESTEKALAESTEKASVESTAKSSVESTEKASFPEVSQTTTTASHVILPFQQPLLMGEPQVDYHALFNVSTSSMPVSSVSVRSSALSQLLRPVTEPSIKVGSKTLCNTRHLLVNKTCVGNVPLTQSKNWYSLPPQPTRVISLLSRADSGRIRYSFTPSLPSVPAMASFSKSQVAPLVAGINKSRGRLYTSLSTSATSTVARTYTASSILKPHRKNLPVIPEVGKYTVPVSVANVKISPVFITSGLDGLNTQMATSCLENQLRKASAKVGKTKPSLLPFTFSSASTDSHASIQKASDPIRHVLFNEAKAKQGTETVLCLSTVVPMRSSLYEHLTCPAPLNKESNNQVGNSENVQKIQKHVSDTTQHHSEDKIGENSAGKERNKVVNNSKNKVISADKNIDLQSSGEPFKNVLPKALKENQVKKENVSAQHFHPSVTTGMMDNMNETLQTELLLSGTLSWLPGTAGVTSTPRASVTDSKGRLAAGNGHKLALSCSSLQNMHVDMNEREKVRKKLFQDRTSEANSITKPCGEQLTDGVSITVIDSNVHDKEHLAGQKTDRVLNEAGLPDTDNDVEIEKQSLSTLLTDKEIGLPVPMSEVEGGCIQFTATSTPVSKSGHHSDLHRNRNALPAKDQGLQDKQSESLLADNSDHTSVHWQGKLPAGCRGELDKKLGTLNSETHPNEPNLSRDICVNQCVETLQDLHNKGILHHRHQSFHKQMMYEQELSKSSLHNPSLTNPQMLMCGSHVNIAKSILQNDCNTSIKYSEYKWGEQDSTSGGSTLLDRNNNTGLTFGSLSAVSGDAPQAVSESVQLKSSLEVFLLKKELLVHQGVTEQEESILPECKEASSGKEQEVKQLEQELSQILNKIEDVGNPGPDKSACTSCPVSSACSCHKTNVQGSKGPAFRRHNIKRGLLPKLAIRIMERWYQQNIKHPYPSQETAESLAVSGEIAPEQVKKWFANKRMRSGNTRKAKRAAKGKQPFEALEKIAKKLRQNEQRKFGKPGVDVFNIND